MSLLAAVTLHWAGPRWCTQVGHLRVLPHECFSDLAEAQTQSVPKVLLDANSLQNIHEALRALFTFL